MNDYQSSLLREEFPGLLDGVYLHRLPWGWFNLARTACRRVKHFIDEWEFPAEFRIREIGAVDTMFFIDANLDEVFPRSGHELGAWVALIIEIRERGYRICEECGAMGEYRESAGRVLCAEHYY